MEPGDCFAGCLARDDALLKGVAEVAAGIAVVDGDDAVEVGIAEGDVVRGLGVLDELGDDVGFGGDRRKRLGGEASG